MSYHKTQMDSPAECPISSPSDRPARNEVNSVRGSRASRDRVDNPVETLYSSVPDFGSDLKIDKGSKVVTYE